jgi:hypothetical protein
MENWVLSTVKSVLRKGINIFDNGGSILLAIHECAINDDTKLNSDTLELDLKHEH